MSQPIQALYPDGRPPTHKGIVRYVPFDLPSEPAPIAGLGCGHGFGSELSDTSVRNNRNQRGHPLRFGITIDPMMAQASETPRTGDELEAREELMRQQFERDSEAWEEAVPAEEVLAKLEARITPVK